METKFACGLATLLVVGIGSCSSNPVHMTARPTDSVPTCPTRAAGYVDYLTGTDLGGGSAPILLPVLGADPLAPPGGVTREKAMEVAQRGRVRGTVVSATLGREPHINPPGGGPFSPADRWVWVVIFAGHYGFLHTQCVDGS